MGDPFDYLVHSDFSGNEAQRRLEAEQAVATKPGFIDSLGPAYRMGTLVYGAWRAVGMPSHVFDPDYRLDEAEYSRLTAGLPPEFHANFARARSKMEADSFREQALQEVKDQEALAAAGMAGTSALIGASLLDPLQLALTWGTGGGGAAVGPLGRFVYSGAKAGLANAAISAGLESMRMNPDGSHIVGAGLLGFALGGPLGLLSKGENLAVTELANNGAARVATASADDLAGKVPKSFQAFSPEQIRKNGGASAHLETGNPPTGGFMVSVPGEKRIPLASYKHQDALDFLEQRKATLSNQDDAFLGAWVDGEDVVLDISKNHAGLQSAMDAGRAAGQDAIYDVTKAEAVSLKDIGFEKPHIKGPPAVLKDADDLILEGSVGSAQGLRIPDDGTAFNQIRIPGTNLKFSLRYDIFAQLDRSKNAAVRALNKRWFEDAVGSRSFSWVDDAGMKHTQKAAQRMTLTGYATMEFKRFWAPTRQALDAAFDEYAIANKLSVKEKYAGEIPKQFFKQVTDELKGIGHGTDPHVKKAAEAMRSMKQRLNAELKLMGWKHADEAKTEMGFFDDFLNAEGEVKPTNAREYLEMDARALGNDFAKKATGYLGAAKVGVRSLEDKKALYEQVLAGAQPGDVSTKEALELFDKGWKWATGAPMDRTPFSTARDTAVFLKNLNFVRAMGQVGFAQLAEIGNLMGYGGWKAFLRGIPAARDMVKLAKLGKVDSQLARDLSAMIGDSAWETANVAWRRDVPEIALHPNLVRANNFAAQTREFVAHVSGLRQVNNMLKASSESVMAQRMMDLASGFTKITDNMRLQLATAGLEEDGLEAVFSNLRKFGKLGGDGKLLSLDGEAWRIANRESYDLFRMALFRDVNRVVQDTTIGENCWWMHTALGQVATQFRSFMLGAWAKQTLYGVNHGGLMNPNVTFAWGMSMFFGGLSYVAQASINNVHDSEKLSKALSVEKIAMAAFNRAGFTSLIPMLTDTALDVTGNPMLFSHARSSGLPTTIFGNPTLDFGNRLYSSLKAVGSATLGGREGLNRGQARTIMGLLAPNVLGVRNFLDLLSEQYPERTEFETTEVADFINAINQR
jgi:hypothetical protein